MKTLLALGFLALGSLAVVGFKSPAADGIQPGAEAPPLNAKTWFNHIGRPLELDNLGGNAVLVEFWATW
ncbi:MAG: hypothetical protein NTY35_10070 [Planctomycetota bacterium]|nr:hypothetical protein [Planctomycetota bacterium]